MTNPLKVNRELIFVVVFMFSGIESVALVKVPVGEPEIIHDGFPDAGESNQ
jgi:hypothetical protein